MADGVNRQGDDLAMLLRPAQHELTARRLSPVDNNGAWLVAWGA